MSSLNLKPIKNGLTPSGKLTVEQRRKLTEDARGLVERHGWDSFAEAVETICERVAFHGYLSEWIWEERARLVRRTRAVPRRKSS